MPILVMNICAKFYSNPSTKYGDVTSREIGVSDQRTPAGQPDRQLKTRSGWPQSRRKKLYYRAI